MCESGSRNAQQSNSNINGAGCVPEHNNSKEELDALELLSAMSVRCRLAMA